MGSFFFISFSSDFLIIQKLFHPKNISGILLEKVVLDTIQNTLEQTDLVPNMSERTRNVCFSMFTNLKERNSARSNQSI